LIPASVGCVLRTISPYTVVLHRQKCAWDAPYACFVVIDFVLIYPLLNIIFVVIVAIAIFGAVIVNCELWSQISRFFFFFFHNSSFTIKKKWKG